MRRLLVLLALLAAAGAGLVLAGERDLGPLVITHEGEQKMILRFSDPRTVTAPGVALRIPLIETVKGFDRRLLYLNTEPLPIPTKDEERIPIDNYVLWRIADPERFHASFPGGLPAAEDRIDQIVRADVREVIGKRTLAEVLTEARIEIMGEITAKSREALVKSGIEVVDVRINRTELPEGTEQSVYARMKADRERLARKHRAEGEERARRIRAEADREAQVIVANARRDAEITRGEGDAEATRIYGEAYSSEPAFYAFMRSLEAYRSTIGENTTLVLSPQAEFFQFFDSATLGKDGGPP